MKKLLFLVLSIALFTSCTKDEVKDEQLSGEWYLTNAYCFCLPESEIDINEFTLSFGNSNQQVTIGNPAATYYYIAEDGTYKYNLDNRHISFEGISPGFTYSIENDILTLVKIDDPQIADDELTLVFKKK